MRLSDAVNVIEVNRMTFGEAVEALKNGEIIRRKGREWCVKIVNGTIENTHKNVFTDKNDIWFCSADVLANDWEIVKVEKTSEELKKENEELKLMVEKSKYKVIQMCNEIEKLKVQIGELIDEQPIQEQ